MRAQRFELRTPAPCLLYSFTFLTCITSLSPTKPSCFHSLAALPLLHSPLLLACKAGVTDAQPPHGAQQHAVEWEGANTAELPQRTQQGLPSSRPLLWWSVR